MKQKFISIKRILFFSFLILGNYFYSQIRISNSIAISSAPNSSAFIDASSNPSYNSTTNIGKGLLFPRTDLTTFTAFSQAPFGIANNYPFLYDGFILFNTATSGVAGVGSTEGTLCRGFWYYDNPSNLLNGGTWKPVRPDLCTVTPPPFQFDCAGTIPMGGNFVQGAPVLGSDKFNIFQYTSGNGASYSAQSIPSTGVTGLTATLNAGTLANGTSGNFVLIITGIPSTAGTASFTFTLEGQTCTFTRIVDGSGGGGGGSQLVMCGSSKAWMTHNLGADINQNPATPTQATAGNYYQWGRINPVATAYSTAGAIGGWDSSTAPNGSWSASKTANDPCPSGFRVPTSAEWATLNTNNNRSNVGTFSTGIDDPTNFGAALQYTCTNNGNTLIFPAAGYRGTNAGQGMLEGRGITGDYWSVDESGTTNAFQFFFNSSLSGNGNQSQNRSVGMSVRCIQE
ncbi:FISUMP domain-containing protein [Chryseobacterium fistulae]|uniref:Fibrobacter succinogenes major paralogous domain-containing protein n=1 Tax=Chryseobacterium fistulae TaxID=2675058 RepID=A0A6N4XT29_9FLAO|nr:FISUMP domain-containing protein [Chryseobacterium fistulae]CAA7390374.1 hypothetical protein CHRY9393_02679 [Chryseobacterium fistulae]